MRCTVRVRRGFPRYTGDSPAVRERNAWVAPVIVYATSAADDDLAVWLVMSWREGQA